jgi:hypothetical protein
VDFDYIFFLFQTLFQLFENLNNSLTSLKLLKTLHGTSLWPSISYYAENSSFHSCLAGVFLKCSSIFKEVIIFLNMDLLMLGLENVVYCNSAFYFL